MRRITTPTASEDLFGTGLDGFIDGTVPTPPPTHLNADWFNQVQEEIARAVEGNGATVVASGGTPNYYQLDDAISDMARVVACSGSTSNRYVTEGLTFNISGTSLSTTLAQGRMVFDGRKYNISTAKLTAAGFVSWGPLTASRDHYFFIAPENPGALATPPNRNTVYVTRTDVANGASAPATPAGTVLFAMLVTSGTDITAATYYNRGPRLMGESFGGVALRPNLGTNTRTTLHPLSGIDVDLGYTVADSQEGYWAHAYVEELHLRTNISSLFTYADDYRFTFVTSVGVGATVDSSVLLDADDWPDGTVALVEIRSSAIDPSDPTDGYVCIARCMVCKDGTTWDMNSTGGIAVEFEAGTSGAAAGMNGDFHLDGTNTQLLYRMTGHSGDATRWFNVVHITMNGN